MIIFLWSLFLFLEFICVSHQVLKGVPERPEVALVKLREIKHKIDRRANAQDRFSNQVSLKDVVKILEGPFKVSLLYPGIQWYPVSGVHNFWAITSLSLLTGQAGFGRTHI